MAIRQTHPEAEEIDEETRRTLEERLRTLDEDVKTARSADEVMDELRAKFKRKERSPR